MNVEQARSLYEVGTLMGATVLEKPTAAGPVWMLEFSFCNRLPPLISPWLEAEHGGPRLYHQVESALADIQSIGISHAHVDQVGSGKAMDCFASLYPWLCGLHALGYDRAALIDALRRHPATQLDSRRPQAVQRAQRLLDHALGLDDGTAFATSLPTMEVLAVHLESTGSGGHLCHARCTDGDSDFMLLVPAEIPEKQLRYVLADHQRSLCALVYIAYCLRGAPATTPAFTLTRDDIDYLRSLVPGSTEIMQERLCAHCGEPITDDYVTGPARMVARAKQSVFFHKRRDNCRLAATRELPVSG